MGREGKGREGKGMEELEGDDDKLIVRASAVLKSQGPENWSRGRPGKLYVKKNDAQQKGIFFL